MYKSPRQKTKQEKEVNNIRKGGLVNVNKKQEKEVMLK